MPHLSPRVTKAVSTLVVALLALGVWWLQQGDGGDAGPRDASSASAGRTPGATPSSQPSAQSDDGPSSTTAPPTTSAGTPDGGSATHDEHGLPYVDRSELPPEALTTLALIDAGGPFPHEGKDGSTFGNFEGLLPARERGYYAEYTVETPGVDHRGARRIVAGDGGERYWTEDHYESFERIRP